MISPNIKTAASHLFVDFTENVYKHNFIHHITLLVKKDHSAIPQDGSLFKHNIELLKTIEFGNTAYTFGLTIDKLSFKYILYY